jgi:hypothetical protein
MFGSHVLVVTAVRLFSRLDQRAAHPARKIVPWQKSLLVEPINFLIPLATASFSPKE